VKNFFFNHSGNTHRRWWSSTHSQRKIRQSISIVCIRFTIYKQCKQLHVKPRQVVQNSLLHHNRNAFLTQHYFTKRHFCLWQFLSTEVCKKYQWTVSLHTQSQQESIVRIPHQQMCNIREKHKAFAGGFFASVND